MIALIFALLISTAQAQDKPADFQLIAIADFTEDAGDGTVITRKAGEVTNTIVGYPDGKGGIKGWTPPSNVAVRQVK